MPIRRPANSSFRRNSMSSGSTSMQEHDSELPARTRNSLHGGRFCRLHRSVGRWSIYSRSIESRLPEFVLAWDSHGKVIARKTHFRGTYYWKGIHYCSESVTNVREWSGTYYWKGIHYCSESVTNVREWFDGKSPDVRFQFKDGKLVQLVVRGCDGKDIELLK